MIRVIDYGLGNVQAFINAYKNLNIKAKSSKTINELKDASHIILPGVGSFDQAIRLFNNSGMRDEVERLVMNVNIPILGVCVGMQILGSTSEEGTSKGLGWINGKIKKIRFKNNNPLPLPHMGWNNVNTKNNLELFNELDSQPSFYFLHSFYFSCEDETSEIASFSYGGDLTCAIKKKNIYGVQFHPEKSHHFGAKLLQNFSNI